MRIYNSMGYQWAWEEPGGIGIGIGHPADGSICFLFTSIVNDEVQLTDMATNTRLRTRSKCESKEIVYPHTVTRRGKDEGNSLISTDYQSYTPEFWSLSGGHDYNDTVANLPFTHNSTGY